MHLPSLSCIKMFADNCLKKSFCYEVPRFQPSCREMDCFLEFLTGVIVKASSVLVCTKYILANCRTCLLIFLPSFYSLLATRQIPCYLTRWWEIHSHDKLLLVCIQITCKNGTIYYPASNHNLQFSLYRFDLLVTNYINLDEYVKI